MTAEKLLNLVPYAVSCVVLLGIAGYALRRRQVNGALMYGVTVLAQAATTVAYMLEISADRLPVKVFWDDFQWLTLSVTGVALVVFALQFTEIRVRRLWGLFIGLFVPVVGFQSLVWTNISHGWVRSETVVRAGPVFSALAYDFTLISYAYAGYLLLQGVVVSFLLVWRFFQVQGAYRYQVLTVLIGVGLPTAGGLLTLAGIELTNQRDLSPITFAIGSVVTMWGLYRYRFLDVAPIARATVFNSLSDAVLVIDRLRRVVDLNPAARRLLESLGCQADTIGQMIETCLPDVAPVVVQWPELPDARMMEMMLAGGGPGNCYLVSLTPVVAREQVVTGAVVVLKNITAQKATEAALRQQAADLELARARAERADQLKTQFLASVSHELRTPLNAMLNFNQFVAAGLYGPVNEKQAEALNKSTSSARHLLQLINDVLDMSRIEAGHLELQLEPDVDVAAEVAEAVGLARTLTGDKPITVTQVVADDLPAIVADRRRVRQVLFNLVGNAAKFTEAGEIQVSAWREGEMIWVAVADTGPGIPKEAQTAIFRPFGQLKRDAGKPAGTGLGLPISLRLVEAHGGRIWVESEPGQGATFYVTFPLVASVQQASGAGALEHPLGGA